MNNNMSDDPIEREPARFALLVAGMIARAAAGDVSSDEEPAAVFIARMHGLFDGKEAALLDAYSDVVIELIQHISETEGSVAAVNVARGITRAVIDGDQTLSPSDIGRSRAETLRDIRLAVLGSTRLLLENAPDEDLAILQTFSAEAMLPEVINFLCWSLAKNGRPQEDLEELTQQVLAESLTAEER